MKRSIIYGLLTGAGLIAYFLLMGAIGQEDNFWLRTLNFFIIVGGVFLLFKSTVAKRDGHFGYVQGLSLGLVMSLVAIVTFIAFLTIYIKFLHPGFMSVLEQSKIWGPNLSLREATFAIGIEGVVSGGIISFVWMQYFKGKVEAKDTM